MDHSPLTNNWPQQTKVSEPRPPIVDLGYLQPIFSDPTPILTGPRPENEIGGMWVSVRDLAPLKEGRKKQKGKVLLGYIWAGQSSFKPDPVMHHFVNYPKIVDKKGGERGWIE